jgi:hypothetical protein
MDTSFGYPPGVDKPLITDLAEGCRRAGLTGYDERFWAAVMPKDTEYRVASPRFTIIVTPNCLPSSWTSISILFEANEVDAAVQFVSAFARHARQALLHLSALAYATNPD